MFYFAFYVIDFFVHINLKKLNMTQKMQTIRGIRDLTGLELETYKRIVEIGSRIASLHHYSSVLLPIFEYSSVFFRTLGESSDIVTKETYTFSDRDKRMVTLRPEFTAAVVRSIISNGLTQNMPLRLFTYGPLFRHERPQQGRHRQFYQFDCELFGSASPWADVEVINILMSILKALYLNDQVEIHINSLGDPESTEIYKQELKKYLLQHQDSLSEISKKRLETNPLRVLDTKEEQDLEIVKNAPIISDYLNQESLEHYAAVCEGLSLLNIRYVHNPRLVRGLDYYTHTVFEVVTKKVGGQNAIAAGGRYNGLVEMMGGPATPAVGFAIGIDRTYDLLKQGGLIEYEMQNICYLVPIGGTAENHAVNLADEFRKKGIPVGLDYGLSTKKRLKIADRDKAKICLIFGDDELESGDYIVRDMSNSKEEKVHSEEILEVIIEHLK